MSQSIDIKEIFAQQKVGRLDTVVQLKSNDGKSVDIPISLIKGAKAGPTLTLTAGIHGMEYPTIMSLFDLRKEIDIRELKGNLIIIPIVNLPAFFGRFPFVNPQDGLNLNRSFPGNPNGTITEVMADFFTQGIFPLTDVLVDLHGGDASEELLPFMCYYENPEFPKQTDLARKLCEMSGFETLVSYRYTLPPDKPAMYAFKQAVRQGIVALSVEIGRVGNLTTEEVAASKNAVYSIMAYMQMYRQADFTAENSIKSVYSEQSYIAVPISGILSSDVNVGHQVKKGDKVGFITDVFGNVLTDIYAPASGMVLHMIATPPVNKGETLMCIVY